MARSPLVIQRPQVSLIGGNALPQASGLGVPIPDIYGPFATLGQNFMDIERRRKGKLDAEAERVRDRAVREIERRADQNRQLRDDAAGVAAAEAFVLKDDEGNMMPLPPLDQYKTPEENAAFRRTLYNKYDTAIRNDLSGRLGKIFNRLDLDDDKKLQLAQEALDARVSLLPPEVKQRAIDIGSAEIRQLSEQSARQTAARQEKALFDDAQDRLLNAGKKAESATRNGDPIRAAQSTDDVLNAIDDIADLEKWPEDRRVRSKQVATAAIQANGISGRLYDHLRKGQIASPDILKQLGEAIEHGGEDFKVDAIVPSGVDRFPEGRSYSSKQIREILKDDDKARQLGVELQQMAVEKERRNADTEKKMSLFAEVKRSDKSRPPAHSTEPLFDDWMEQAIANGVLDEEGGFESLIGTQLEYGSRGKPLIDWMVRQARSGTYDQVKKAIAGWQETKTANWGEFKLGDSVVQSMDVKDRQTLDLIQMLLEQTNTPDDFTRLRTETLTRGSPETTITEFNKTAPTGQSYERQMDAWFKDNFESIASMPPAMREQANYAFHTFMLMGGASDPQDAIAKTQSLLEERWESNRIYLDGANAGGPLTNWEGYDPTRSLNSTADPDYDWFQDTMKTVLNDVSVFDQLAMDEEDKARFQRQLAEEAPFGETMFIQRTGRDLKQPRYTVWWQSDTGLEMVRIIQDGKRVPLIVSPHQWRDSEANAYANARREDVIQQEKDDAAKVIEERGKPAGAAEQWRQQQRENPALIDQYNIDPDAAPVLKPDDPFMQGFEPEDESRLEGVDPMTTGSLQEWWEAEKVQYASLATSEPTGDAVSGALFENKATGPEVAAFAAQAVANIVPMEGGGQFLLDIAGYESNYGQDLETFRQSGDVGITQINVGANGAFWGVKTQIANDPDSNVAAAAAKLDAAFNINIRNATVQDLHKPIYAMAFARLHMLSDPRVIPGGDDPQSQATQAYLYKQKYNSTRGLAPVEGKNSFGAFLTGGGRSTRAKMSDYESKAVPYGGPGVITDRAGKPNPQNFITMEPRAQEMLLRLSEAFGMPLQITPHGGRNYRQFTENHPAGLAADIYVADMSDEDKTRLIATAIKLGYRGIGTYGSGSVGFGTIHFDVRPSLGNGPGNLALWYHTNRGDWKRAPKWFRDGIYRGLELKRSAVTV